MVVYDESVQTYKEHDRTWGRMNYATFPAVAGGTFGNGLTWQMSGNGKLTVSGSGAMPDLKDLKEMPWMPYADKLTDVMICEGITHVGAFSFYFCSKIETLYLPATLQSVGEQAFAFNSALTDITCAASVGVPTLPDGSPSTATATSSPSHRVTCAITRLHNSGRSRQRRTPSSGQTMRIYPTPATETLTSSDGEPPAITA